MSQSKPEGTYDNSDIRESLLAIESNGWSPTSELVDDIIRQFWFRDFMSSLISQDPFFTFLQHFLKQTTPAHFNRYDFYQFFFERAFGDQVEQLKALGTVFELMQTDTLSLTEFQTLLHEFELEESIISILTDSRFITIESEQIKWVHHTLTEYLGAGYILQNGEDIEEMMVKLTVFKQGDVKAIKPSWYGVIRFLLESSKKVEVAQWLVNFAIENPDVIDDHYSEVLTSLVYTNAQSAISNELQRQVFFQIYDAYQKQIAWISVWTRTHLGRLLADTYLGTLEDDLSANDDAIQTYVHRGNIVSIIDSAIEHQRSIFTDSQLDFWKAKFIEYANEPSDPKNYGVLQRHCLHALENFNEPEIVDQVAIHKNSSDQLVREAFVQLCTAIATNYHNAIDYVADSIKAGADIYGRRFIQKITDQDAISHLLSLFIDDQEFLHHFLDKDDVFNYREKERKPDEELIEHIHAVFNDEIIEKLKTVIFTAFSLDHVHDINRAYFLKRITQLVVEQDPNFYQEVLDKIEEKISEKDRWHLIFDYNRLFPLIITTENISNFSSRLTSLHELGAREVESAIYSAKHYGGKDGQLLFEFALEQGIIQESTDSSEQIDYEAQRKEQMYLNFTKQLEPAKDQYMPSVFGLYVSNEYLQEIATPEQKARITKLATESSLDKIDPQQFKVQFSDSENKSGQYTITSLASYYGDLIRVGLLLFPEELRSKYRQQIINFIPYAYSDDQQSILDVISNISDEELEWVNSVMLDHNDHRRYLIPSGYLYLISEYLDRGSELRSTVPVLVDLIADDLLSINDRIYAIDVLQKMLKSNDDNKQLFIDLFDPNVSEEEAQELSKKANEVLIEVYQDQSAINWRFEQLQRPIAHEPILDSQHEFSVGPTERELMFGGFARPLIELKQTRLIQEFSKLLEMSFKVLPEKRYQDYSSYLQRIFLDYLRALGQEALPLVTDIESLLDKQNNTNWFKQQLKTLVSEIIHQNGEVDSPDSAIAVMQSDGKVRER